MTYVIVAGVCFVGGLVLGIILTRRTHTAAGVSPSPAVIDKIEQWKREAEQSGTASESVIQEIESYINQAREK
jgi:hypothetical protein